MKSIRRRLLTWFLPGLGMLWLLAGAGVFFSYRAGLIAGVEAELQSLLRQVRAGAGGGGGPGWGGSRREAAATQEDFGPGVYWQLWAADGAVLARSANLAADLPRLEAEHGSTVVRRQVLPDGTRVMLAGTRYGVRKGGEQGGGRWGGGGRGGAVEVAAAKDLAAVDQALARLLAGIGTAGLVGVGLAVMWVRHAVRDGLAPLRRIADQVSGVDAGSLGVRFGDPAVAEELRPIVRRLDELMVRLEAGFARERRFSADLAHEMRTPVAELRLLAESALKWPEEGGQDAWQDVLGSASRMEKVVQAMLHLARLEQAGPAVSTERWSLREAVDDVWQGHAERAANRGVRLRVAVPGEVTVQGDRALWRQLLSILLGNAADHADGAGEVVVDVDPPVSGHGPVVRVTNPALALEPADLDHVFDRFWRGDTARAESEHCGLGLSLARACAEAVGQELHARMVDGEPRCLEMRIGRGG